MKRIGVLLGFFLAFAFAVEVTFTYRPPPGLEVRSVSLRGSFNNWGEWPMKKNPDGSWSLTVDLPPGEHAYKFFINGQWPKDMCNDSTFGTPMVDPQADGCIDDGFGGQNAVRVVEAPQNAGEKPMGLNFEHDPKDARHLSRVPAGYAVRFFAGEGAVERAVILAEDEIPMARQLSYQGREVWRGMLPPSVRRYRIRVHIHGDKTRTFGPFKVPERVFTALGWVGDRVGYQVFPERFWNGDPGNDRAPLSSDEYNFNRIWQQKDPDFRPILSPWNGPITPQHCCHQYFGGDLAGVRAKLDELKKRGVTLVYLNPLFESGSAHGYDTHDYMRVAAKFGNKKALGELLEALHAAGVRVIFDFVPNHTGLGFWAFQDVVRRGPNSPYWRWYFVKKWPFLPGDASAYEAWWGVPSLPKLNTGDPGVRRYLIEVAKYWVRFGFDGVRVDVPTELIGARDFFKTLKAELRKINPEVYLVGEIWELRPDWVGAEAFDSLMNYYLGRKILLTYAKGKPAAFANGKRAARMLAEAYAAIPEAAAAMGFNLIASHDTSRLLTDLGGGRFGERPTDEALRREKLALALLFALPGVPVVWQGDECAFLGEKDPYDKQRYPLQWADCDPGMAAHYRRLAKLKATTPALATSVLREPQGDGPVLAFFRGEPGRGELLALFNNATKPARYVLPTGTWRDAVEGRFYRGAVDLGPLGWRYLVRFSSK